MYRLYTHNDLDGVGCGIVAKYAFGDKAEVRYNSVEGLNVQVQRFLERAKEKGGKHDFLFITDLSVNEDNAKGLTAYTEGGGKAKLLDHHKSALHLNEHNWASVQVKYEDGRLASATSLFYEYLLQNGLIAATPALNEFVELVRLYDTWEWEQRDESRAKRLNDLFYMVSIDEFEEKMTERLLHSEHFAFDEFEEKILDMEEEKIERYVRRKKREIVQTYIADLCVGIVHAESYHSELGSELGKENPHLDYIAILNVGGKKVSLRTIHDHIDVSEIAGSFGGGGHAKASGCAMTDEVYRLYVDKPFQLEPMRADAFKNIYNLKNSPFGSLYENRKDEKLFVFQGDEGWFIDLNGEVLDEPYPSFEEAERTVKREYGAWLVKDDVYVRFLMEQHAGRRTKRDVQEPANKRHLKRGYEIIPIGHKKIPNHGGHEHVMIEQACDQAQAEGSFDG
nr:oligoribonuclease [Paenibacillus hamazuiensis]